MNQGLLQALGVGHSSLSRICNITLESSADRVASKLTGGGGGGCALTLFPSGTRLLYYFGSRFLRVSLGEEALLANVVKALSSAGFEMCFETVLAVPGVSLHIPSRSCPTDGSLEKQYGEGILLV